MTKLNAINILMVADILYILANYPSPSQDRNNPTSMSDGYTFLITDNGHVYKGEVTSELYIELPPEEEGQLSVVRWRASSVDTGVDYQCFITNIIINKGAEYLSAPAARQFTATVPVIDGDKYVSSTFVDHVWESHIGAVNNVTLAYHIQFAIINSQTNSVVGYVQWDPYIDE